jgi:hypothetical protein
MAAACQHHVSPADVAAALHAFKSAAALSPCNQQVLIYKWVPIIGPILGSAFVIGLYIAARLLRGDLTDRMKMMDEGEEKRRRTALKEARIAFLEEEIPALVARKTDMAVIK